MLLEVLRIDTIVPAPLERCRTRAPATISEGVSADSGCQAEVLSGANSNDWSGASGVGVTGRAAAVPGRRAAEHSQREGSAVRKVDFGLGLSCSTNSTGNLDPVLPNRRKRGLQVVEYSASRGAFDFRPSFPAGPADRTTSQACRIRPG